MSSKNILVVDDNSIDRMIIVKGLSVLDSSFNFLEAESCDQALDILDHNQVDIILTDLKMPLVDGTDLCRLMDSLHPGICKIIITGASQEHVDELNVTNAGFSKCFTKPVDFTALMEYIKNQLEE